MCIAKFNLNLGSYGLVGALIIMILSHKMDDCTRFQMFPCDSTVSNHKLATGDCGFKPYACHCAWMSEIIFFSILFTVTTGQCKGVKFESLSQWHLLFTPQEYY